MAEPTTLCEPEQMLRGATISPDGLYRYDLWRRWKLDTPQALWIMLNPSTADADLDDPTIRRVMRFSADAGYGGCIVVNLFAYRATDPKQLVTVARHGGDPVGPENLSVIQWWMNSPIVGRVICAWGAGWSKIAAARPSIESLAHKHHVYLWCLGTTKDGHPRHPLYVRSDQPLVRFDTRPAARSAE